MADAGLLQGPLGPRQRGLISEGRALVFGVSSFMREDEESL